VAIHFQIFRFEKVRLTGNFNRFDLTWLVAVSICAAIVINRYLPLYHANPGFGWLVITLWSALAFMPTAIYAVFAGRYPERTCGGAKEAYVEPNNLGAGCLAYYFRMLLFGVRTVGLIQLIALSTVSSICFRQLLLMTT